MIHHEVCTVPSSYSIGTHFEALVRDLVGSGRYNNASEVLRDGLRLLEERERRHQIEIAELRRLVEEGRLSGPSDEEGFAFLARLEAKYQAMADKQTRRR
jgi:antitoxin ParD1/3/4